MDYIDNYKYIDRWIDKIDKIDQTDQIDRTEIDRQIDRLSIHLNLQFIYPPLLRSDLKTTEHVVPIHPFTCLQKGPTVYQVGHPWDKRLSVLSVRRQDTSKTSDGWSPDWSDISKDKYTSFNVVDVTTSSPSTRLVLRDSESSGPAVSADGYL